LFCTGDAYRVILLYEPIRAITRSIMPTRKADYRLPDLPLELARKRIIPAKQAAGLRGVSVATLKRQCRDKLIKIIRTQSGMRVEDALMLDDSGSAPP
jgi:hypothetical protein